MIIWQINCFNYNPALPICCNVRGFDWFVKQNYTGLDKK